MAHKLSKSHKEMCQKIKKYKADNIENKEEFYLILEHPTLELILKADVTPSSKILLVYILPKKILIFNLLFYQTYVHLM